MLLTRTSQYAIRAAIHLAGRNGRASQVGEIAEALDLPRNYLSKILHRLARAGVLASERGRSGGFRLAVDPAALSLERIVEPVEPGVGARRCLLGRAECRDADPCPVHERWRELSERIGVFLRETTLADLARRPGPGEPGAGPLP